jgi:hypothetical protein
VPPERARRDPAQGSPPVGPPGLVSAWPEAA